MMSKDRNKQLKMKFDHDWYYCSRPSTDQNIDIITNSSKNDDYHWTAIQLPHIIDGEEEGRSGSSVDHQQNWWYRKQFEWKAHRDDSDHRFYLLLKSIDKKQSEENEDDYSSVDTLTVWLNGIEIFSNSFQSPSVSIELTEQIIYKNPSEEMNGKNTLLMCCHPTSFSLHVYLLLPRDICEVIDDENIEVGKKKTSNALPVRTNRVLDYLIKFNDADGLFDIDVNPKLKVPTKSKQQTRSPMLVHGHHEQINEQEDAISQGTNTCTTVSLPTDSILNYLVSSNHNDIIFDCSSESKQGNLPDIVVSEPHDQTDKQEIEEFHVPRLAIVMLIVGTRGDVQPFVAFGQTLHAAGHRVRLATHEKFRKFVREHGLEFFPLASNPDDLMSFVVKNGGVVPSMNSILEGDLKKKRRDISDILQSTWLACTENDDETTAPFTAEVIIANPPSFGHVHCAQKLQIPLHMMFTMPWSPTTEFAHAFCKVDYSKEPREKLNLLSYDVIETLTWSSMRDLANTFRRETLGLPPVHLRQGIRMLIDEQVPHTYCWSPSLVSAPHDWPHYVNVSGYFFLNSDDDHYKPPDELAAFLGLRDDKEKKAKVTLPIYIGFGSITGNDSNRLLKVIVKALEITNYRALLSGFDKNNDTLPDNILKISDTPHDWLFQHVSAVCHHGGAGTTAAGLRAGKPSIIVPFFGDQFFWGNVVEKCGAGPSPLPGKQITVNELVDAFTSVHESPMRIAAERIRDAISLEDGCATALRLFHSHLPLSRMRSDLEPTFAACYRVDDYDLQVSRPVAQVLIAAGVLDESQFSWHPTREWTSIYDNRVHVPTSGVLKHTRKALSHIFLHTTGGLRRAVSGGNLLVGVVQGVGGVCKNVGQGVAHLPVGVLSLYGELTDVLDRVPSLYDPYSEMDEHERPRVTDFKSGARAAGLSIAYGWKDGVTGFVRKPRVGYRRHGILGGATGALVATANGFVKPTVGSLASVTWLSRGMYASIKKKRRRKSRPAERSNLINKISVQSTFSLSSSTDDNEEKDSSDHDDNDNIPRNIKFAAVVSGYPADVCQHIVDQFNEAKKHQEEIAALSPNQTDKHQRTYLCRRHRRHSDSAL